MQRPLVPIKVEAWVEYRDATRAAFHFSVVFAHQGLANMFISDWTAKLVINDVDIVERLILEVKEIEKAPEGGAA